DVYKRQLRERAAAHQHILSLVADVACPRDVGRIVDAVMTTFRRVDILVNNAGIYGPMGLSDEVDWDAWRYAIEVNLFGSVLMCRAVVPYMKAQRYGKIIQLSGGGATAPLPNLSAYAAAKAAVVRFAESLAQEVRQWHIDVNAVAPGALNTRLLDDVLAAGPEKVGAEFYTKAVRQKETGGVGFEPGARLCVFLASAASDGITGKLISAVWDRWDLFPSIKDELMTSDVYTLRRICARDRGKAWDK
ncbi:MAG: SDR family oxidoreductase, partial [bacterium]|nr:SDR family oxidoreductase [bacterium]